MKFKFLIIITLLFPAVIFAQTGGASLVSRSVYINMSPELPAPGALISLEVKSASINIDASKVSWFLSGQDTQSGIGLKKITTTAPASGDTLGVSVTVLTSSGVEYSKSLVIRPASVDILWEAHSYTPPFYKGKGLLSHEALVKVMALPDFLGGVSNNKDNYIFTWKKDGTVLGSLSGRGKNVQIFRMPKLVSSMRVEVEAVDISGVNRAKGVLNLSSRDPLVLIYENDPLFGVNLDKALSGNTALVGNEISLVGYPYFFSEDHLVSSKLLYSWQINRSVSTSKTNEIVLRAPEKIIGTSDISFRVENIKEIMQSARTKIGIIFGDESSDTNPFF